MPSPTPSPIVDGLDPQLTVGLVGVAGALLGALVGAFASYWASIALQKRARQARAAIRRKAKLYTPLRAELLQLLDRLQDPDVYRIPIQTEGEVPQTLWARPYFTMWSQMKADGRAVSVAASIARSIENTVAQIDNFNRTLKETQETVDEVAREIFREEVGTDLPLMNWAESGGTDAVVRNSDDWELFYEDRESHRDQEDAIKERVNTNDRISQARDAMKIADKALRESVKASLTSLENAMERIARKYEHEPPED